MAEHLTVTCPNCGEELTVTLTAHVPPFYLVGGPIRVTISPDIPDHVCPHPPGGEDLPEAI